VHRRRGYQLPVGTLLDRIEAKHIEPALPAWLESGKPPDALPEFVQPPAEAETAP
jgi:hypothetical protein